MKYKRKVRFQYFHLFYEIIEDGQIKRRDPFNLALWLLKMKEQGTVRRTLELYDTLARIDKIQYDDVNKLWFVRFMKLRDINIPAKVKDNAEAEAIELEDDEYIGEDMTLLYDEASGIIMSQCNRFSLGVNRIAELIRRTINRDDVKIEFAPFLDVKSDRLEKCDFRNIEITFANLTNMPLLRAGKRTLAGIISTYKSMGAVTGKITYSLGHSKINSLNQSAAQELVYDLNENKEYIHSAKVKVTYENDENSEPEMIDLFDNLLQDWIEFTLHSREILSMEQVTRSMTARYVKRREELYEIVKMPLLRKDKK